MVDNSTIASYTRRVEKEGVNPLLSCKKRHKKIIKKLKKDDKKC